MIAALGIAALLGCFLDREIGDGEKGLIRRSAAVAIAVLAPLLAGWLLSRWDVMLLGVWWAVYRAGFGFFGGSMTAVDRGSAISAVVRHAIIILPALWPPLGHYLLPLACYAAAAVLGAIYLGQEKLRSDRLRIAFDDSDQVLVEHARGFLAGLAFAIGAAGAHNASVYL